MGKKSPRITDGELHKLLGSLGQNVSQTIIKHPIYDHKLFERVPRRKPLLSRTSSYSLPNIIGTFSGIVFCGQNRKWFLVTKPRGEFGIDPKIAMQSGRAHV